ncbi:hypothetical protein LDENG_00095070 [Lucifuga dentata]|nr:hypothetical protein LDENG_00095070 [Lucifuga dentata]
MCRSSKDGEDNPINVTAELERSQNATTDATVEVQQYISEAYLSRGEDPLNYWATRETVYSNLCKHVKRYLHMQATSAPCEWVFSKAGEVVSRQRSRLKPNMVEMILF